MHCFRIYPQAVAKVTLGVLFQCQTQTMDFIWYTKCFHVPAHIHSTIVSLSTVFVLLLEKIVISNLLIVSAMFFVLHLLFENILNFIKYFYTIRK